MALTDNRESRPWGPTRLALLAYSFATTIGFIHAQAYYGAFNLNILNYVHPIDLLFISLEHIDKVLVVTFLIVPVVLVWVAVELRAKMGGYPMPHAGGQGRGQRPVINVSWNDVQRYVRWLSKKTEKSYRLLSESEWEYAARAGTQTAYSWGDQIGVGRANCHECGSQWDSRQTAPAGSFEANRWALHDMHGNVWEWVEDCRNGSYAGAPRNGTAWQSENCSERVLRSGSWGDVPESLRAVRRIGVSAGNRTVGIGFRVARTLAP